MAECYERASRHTLDLRHRTKEEKEDSRQMYVHEAPARAHGAAPESTDVAALAPIAT